MGMKRINKIFGLFLINIHLSYSTFENDGLKQVFRDRENELHCQNWNATIITNGDSLEKLVQATLQPFPDYVNCFTHYFAYLHLLRPKHFECSVENGLGITRHKKMEEYNQGRGRHYKVNFTHLEDRYYCILFQPCAESCYNRYLQSNVIIIKESPAVTPEQNLVNETTSSKATDIAYICVVLILTLISSIIIYWNYKHRKIRKIPGIILEEGTDTPFLSSTNAKASDTQVTICYYPNENTKKLVDCFADFLQKCAKFSVTVIDDREPIIQFSGASQYFEAILQDFCSKFDSQCVCNKRFIIFMTDHDIAYMHSVIKDMSNLNELANDDMQAGWFLYALNRICLDYSKCLKDYTHFSAIYFGDIPYIKEHDIITIAPGVRFPIEHKNEILKLCQQLNSLYKEPSHLCELMNSLDKHPIKQIILDEQ